MNVKDENDRKNSRDIQEEGNSKSGLELESIKEENEDDKAKSNGAANNDASNKEEESAIASE